QLRQTSTVYSCSTRMGFLSGFLHGDHVAKHLVGDAEPAILGHCIGQLFGLHGAPGLLAEASAKTVFGFDGSEHFLGQKVEEHALEVFCLLLEPVELRRLECGLHRGGDFHYSTSISAWRAPVALMAWR